MLNALATNRFLLRELVRRDFQSRYAGSVLGFVWSFIYPLFLLVLFTFAFSTVMKIRLDGFRTDNFSLFLFAALLPWLAFQEGVTRGAVAITDNANLVKKLRFPAELLVLSVVLTALVHQAIGAGLFLIILGGIGQLDPSRLPVFLIALPIQLLLTLGLAFLLAALQVFFRDTAQVMSMVTQAWFYLTPIVYPLTLVPHPYDVWIAFNPVTGLVGLYRDAFGLGPAVPWVEVALVGLLSLAVFLIGWWFFCRAKPAFVDEV